MPAVVFVTAYDEYALQAFEVHAIDYLLKPFGRDRFPQTLQHARAHLERRRAGDLGKRLMALVQDIKPEPQRLDRLVVKSGGRVFFLRTDDIDWIEAAGNYVRLHLGEDSHLFRETMNDMEGRLDPRRFVRIHRSRIVNTDRIKELQPWFNGEYVVVLQNGTRLTLSRGYREKLQERLGQRVLTAAVRRASHRASCPLPDTVRPGTNTGRRRAGADWRSAPVDCTGATVSASASAVAMPLQRGSAMAARHPDTEKALAAAIRQGAHRRPDQAFGDYYRGRRASCALGRGLRRHVRAARRHGGAASDQGPGGRSSSAWRAPFAPARSSGCGKRLSLASQIVHLNDAPPLVARADCGLGRRRPGSVALRITSV